VKNNPEHKEEERKAEEQPLSPFLQKKNNPEISQNKSSRRKSPPAFQPELRHRLHRL
jgi:hypothetical protein